MKKAKPKQVIKYPSKKMEATWHIVNSVLSGALVLLGSFATTGEIESKGLLVAGATAGIVAFTKFKDFWDSEKEEYTHKFLHFVG